ncbi:hypothetical protein [Novosphingobium sp. 9]|uniref:hypothetical protein n=1 Tax=Novosphingobium sp. 9 TaxID=2025349 RepID=UPI0021B50D67|nr:hypothetical protein [Novosphingobium sp. 9]
MANLTLHLDSQANSANLRLATTQGVGMLAELSAALGSLKAMSDIVKGLNASFTEAKLNEVKLDFQRALIEATQALANAQASEAAAAARIRDLEDQIVKLKDWSAEKERYALHDIGRGAFAYVPKLGMENAEPPHWLCVNCFDHGRKSALQNKGNGVGNRTIAERGLDKTFACNHCSASIQVSWNNNPVSDRNAMEKKARAPQGSD